MSFYYLDGEICNWWVERPMDVSPAERTVLDTVVLLLDAVDVTDGKGGKNAEIPGVGYWWYSYVRAGIKVKAYAVEKSYLREQGVLNGTR